MDFDSKSLEIVSIFNGETTYTPLTLFVVSSFPVAGTQWVPYNDISSTGYTCLLIAPIPYPPKPSISINP